MAAKPTVAILEEQGIPRLAVDEAFAAHAFHTRWLANEADEKTFAADNEAAEFVEENVIALVTVKRPITSEVLARFPKLRVVAVAFTGFGVHDLDACKEAGVAVYNVPDYSSDSVAEMAIGLTLSVLREIPAGDAALRTKQGAWAISAGGSDLRGKTVGIYGTGTIGLKTARLFAAFGCEVIGYSRTERAEFAAVGRYVPREELFAKADVVSVHVPFNPETVRSIGAEDLARLKPSAVFINTARGGVVDEVALAAALKAGKFRAGLDVFAEEPLRADAAIIDAVTADGGSQRSVLTPHVAYKTTQALARRIQITVANVITGLTHGASNRVA